RVSTRAILDFGDKSVVVGGIVMGQRQVAHARRRGDIHGVFVSAVTPVLFGRVFLRRVLSIVNHHAGASHEARVPAVPLVRDVFGSEVGAAVVRGRFGKRL